MAGLVEFVVELREIGDLVDLVRWLYLCLCWGLGWYAGAGGLGDGAQGGFDLRLDHLAERCAEEGLGQVADMIWDTLAQEEHGKVLGEIVAIVEEEVVGLGFY